MPGLKIEPVESFKPIGPIGMSRIRCLLVDDEHLALALLEKYISRIPDLEVAGVCKSPIRAVELLQQEAIDLLFLDIQMPFLSGINLLRSISNKPVTIFTTAYPQHAHEAYDLDAVDYLLKPYSFERFSHAVQKARDALSIRRAVSAPEGVLTVRVERRLVKIPYEEILYIEGWKEYVKIHTGQGKVVTLESLSRLEETLPVAHFLRVHKSWLVAVSRVTQLDGNDLLVGSARIPVSRTRKSQVLALLFPTPR